jgi:2-hydroxychromene-2-carboxylate isomerase
VADDVTFWFDPGCPWTWATSRWLVDAARERDLRVRWRPMSLAILNADRELEPWLRERLELGARVLRVVAAVRDNDARERFFETYATRVHERKEPFEAATVEAALRDAHLDPALVAAMDDDTWDVVVRAEHEAAQEAAGGESGSPVMEYRGVGWFGPVLSPAPRGAEAGEVWDDLTRFITRDEVFEVKRGRTRGPAVA